MASSIRVFNQTRGFYMKRNQALKAVEVCACAWVDFGSSVRDLTLSESIAMRNAVAKLTSPLAFAELPGIVFRPCERDIAQTRRAHQLVREANQFAAMQ